ncbi:hypothetical protein NL676_034865 [Syzygium grande]|nr:hypothetical protein NL676_034865 [Syzygium grande]
MQIGEGSKKRTPQQMNSSVLNPVSVSNESANIIITSLKTGFRHLVQKLFPFYLQPWTRQESTRMGGLSLPWFLKPQILQNLEASCNLKEQVTVLADSDERHDRLIVATDLFPNDQIYENHGTKHFLTRFTDPFQDLLSGFSSMEMKLSVRSQDLSLHELILGSKIHHSAGSPDLLRKILKGADKVIEVAITQGGGKMIIQSEETLRMMSCRWNNIPNGVLTVVSSSPKAIAIFIITRDDRFSDPESRERNKNASKTLLYVDSADANVIVNMKVFVCRPTRNGLHKIAHSTLSRPTADLLSCHACKHD